MTQPPTQTPSSQTKNEITQPKERRIKTKHILLLSAAIQIGLLIYAQYVDSNPEKYGGLKYTDVDWRVISDGTKLIFNPNKKEGNLAGGWLVDKLGLNIGDPYERSTFRYTPLLSLLISPCLIHPLIGRSILVLVSLIIPRLLLSLSSSFSAGGEEAFWLIHSIWTLNPFVLNINTRGSPESIICLLSILVLYYLKRGEQNKAAIWLGISISWKIYPMIYVPAIWSFLAHSANSRKAGTARRNGWFGRGIWEFGVVTLGTVGLINGLLWSIWGEPFIRHTYLYHLSRLDHRHNFSPYFYPIYLSLFPNQNSLESTNSSTTIIPELVKDVLRHPLTSFLPQNSLVLLVGFVLQPITNLEFTMFIQTAVFVVFNKVCTSQYFMWFIPFFPLIIPHLHLTRYKTIALVGFWIIGQAIWLSIGYQLEFMVKQVFLYLWMAGLLLFGISVWIIGEILDGFKPSHTRRASSGVDGNGVTKEQDGTGGTVL